MASQLSIIEECSVINVVDFIDAGATAVAVGGGLVKKKTIAEGRFEDLTETARQFVAAVHQGWS